MNVNDDGAWKKPGRTYSTNDEWRINNSDKERCGRGRAKSSKKEREGNKQDLKMSMRRR